MMRFLNLILVIILALFTTNCGIFKKDDPNKPKKVKKNNTSLILNKGQKTLPKAEEYLMRSLKRNQANFNSLHLTFYGEPH